LTLLFVTVITFAVTNILPGNVALLILGPNATDQSIQALQSQLGLDQPLYIQYVDWMVGLVQGDMGTSLRFGEPVAGLIAEKLGRSLLLATAATAIAVLFAIPLGVISAVKQNELPDLLASMFGFIGISIPIFLWGLVFILVFAVWFGLFPTGGYVPPSEDPVATLTHLVLPASSMGFALTAYIMRMTRSSMLEVLSEEYINLARAKELGGNTIVENRSGASGRTGMNYLSTQDPDGYSLIAQYLPTTILGAALFDTQYDPSTLTPMGTVDAGYSVLVAPAGRYEDLNDMMAQLGDGEFTMASTGTGSTTHFSGVSVLDSLGIDYRNQVTAVPFDSGSEAGAAAASGDVDIAYSSSDLTGLVQDGRLDVLLVDRPTPSPRYPDAPTANDISEWDIPVVAGEMAIHGPPGVEDAPVSAVSDAIVAACQDEEYQEFVENNGLSVVGVGAEETQTKMDDLQAAASRYRELTQ
jgi:tripartite-type tricarboxylate transporter receptor subunit TctC